MEEHFADGSTEVLAFRGVEFTVWRTFTDDGRRRPIRRWHYAVGDFQGIAAQRTDVVRCAQSIINDEFDPPDEADLVLDGLLQKLRRDYGFVRHSDPTARRDSLGREREQKLRNMTVERGCTEGEAAIAKQKLAELIRQD